MNPIIVGWVIVVLSMVWMIAVTATLLIEYSRYRYFPHEATLLIGDMWFSVALGFEAAIGVVLIWLTWKIEES